MSSRGTKNKADDNGTGLTLVKMKKRKLVSGKPGSKGDQKDVWQKHAPAIAGDSKMHDALEESDSDSEPGKYSFEIPVCWGCERPCPPTTGYCYTCLLFVKAEDIDKHPTPRMMPVEAPVYRPVVSKEFFARVIEGITRSIGRVTQFKQRTDSPVSELFALQGVVPVQYTLITYKLTEQAAGHLIGFIKQAQALLSSTVMQLQIDVERQYEGDRFTFTYRSPSSPLSAGLPCEIEHGFLGFKAGSNVYYVEQDNDEDKKLPLGFGEVEVTPEFFLGFGPLVKPGMGLDLGGAFKFATDLLAGYKHNMADIQKRKFWVWTINPGADDELKRSDEELRAMASLRKQKDLVRAFEKMMLPVLDLCMILGMGHVLPQLLGDTPGHNMSGSKKTAIFNLF